MSREKFLKKLTKSRLLMGMFSVGMIVTLVILPASAQQLSNETEETVISPVKQEVVVNPGETITGTVKVINNRPESSKLYYSVLDFDAKDKYGTPNFIVPQQNRPDDQYMMVDWIELPARFEEYEAGEKKELTFTLTVPENAPPGGHYGAVVVSQESPEGGGIGAVGSVASLVLLTVRGDLYDDGQLVRFDVMKWFSFDADIPFETEYENLGNVHVKPVGNIEIFDWRGEKVTNMPVNEDFSSVLPKSSRIFTNNWTEDGFKIGWFKAKLGLTVVSPVTTEHVATAERWVIIIPWQILVVILIAILVILTLIIVWKLGEKRGQREKESKPGVERKPRR